MAAIMTLAEYGKGLDMADIRRPIIEMFTQYSDVMNVFPFEGLTGAVTGTGTGTFGRLCKRAIFRRFSSLLKKLGFVFWGWVCMLGACVAFLGTSDRGIRRRSASRG